MMMAIRASIDAITPKMIVPVASEFGSVEVGAGAVVESMVGKDWSIEVALSAGMFAVRCFLSNETGECRVIQSVVCMEVNSTGR